ncbi:MAG: TlpA family protein disulfide reductase [Bacteroidetes bacterium]|nr:MAG: TlpA family protein disulfide reductase [Bacteroidota bacterium]TAG88495.1 MAG: TlpA family protein disulfide reductase [Bacteroidota bacterium]
MKKNLFFSCILVIFISQILFAQNNILIEGKIKNYPNSKFEMVLLQESSKLEREYFTIETDKNGNFKKNILIIQPIVYLSLRDSVNNIFYETLFEKGDILKIEYDFKSYEKTLKMEGNAAWKVDYSKKDYALFKKMYNRNPREPFKMSLENHFKWNDSLKKLRLKEYQKITNKASKIFQEVQEGDLCGALSANYPSFYDVNIIEKEKTEEEKNKIVKYYQTLAIENMFVAQQTKNLIYSKNYDFFMNNISYKSIDDNMTLFKTDSNHYHQSKYFFYKAFFITELAEKFLGSILIKSDKNNPFSSDTTIIKDYLLSYKPNLYTEIIKKRLYILKNFQEGKPAYNFELKDDEDKKVSLKDLKGKTILIDFWGTWCRPCRTEHQFMLEMATKTIDNPNIIYVWISFFDNKKAWLDYINLKNAKKSNIIHLFAEEKQAKELQFFYNFTSAPSKQLIDKNGNLIKTDFTHIYKENKDEIVKILENKDK